MGPPDWKLRIASVAVAALLTFVIIPRMAHTDWAAAGKKIFTSAFTC